jgi:hypothetical protein
MNENFMIVWNKRNEKNSQILWTEDKNTHDNAPNEMKFYFHSEFNIWKTKSNQWQMMFCLNHYYQNETDEIFFDFSSIILINEL